jgi:hypothetical protein
MTKGNGPRDLRGNNGSSFLANPGESGTSHDLAARTYATGMRTIGGPDTRAIVHLRWEYEYYSPLFWVISGFGADTMTAPRLIELARSKAEALAKAIPATFDSNELKTGSAWAARGSEFFFAIEAATKPLLFIDDARGPEMQQLSGTRLWFTVANIAEVGKLHSLHYLVNGATFGGRLDVPAFEPLSYLQPGVPSGKLSGLLFIPAKSTTG